MKTSLLRRSLSLLLTLCLLLGLVTLPAAADGGSDPVVIDPVAEFGADPSGATDSTLAIWKAFEAAKTRGNHGATAVTIRFPQGEYHLYKENMQRREWHTSNTDSTNAAYHTKYIGLLLEEQHNVTLDGGGSLFMMHGGNVMAFSVAHSENITVENLSWDYFVPTISEMVVLDAADSYVDYYIPAAYPYEISGNTIRWSGGTGLSGQEYWSDAGLHSNSYSVIAYNPEQEMTRAYGGDGPFGSVTGITQREDRVVRITYSNNKSARASIGIVNGAVFQFTSSGVRPTAGGFNWESSNLLFRNIKCHSTDGFGWLTQMCRDVTFDHCDFLPREGAGRMTTSYADGLHASGSAGYFKILNCNFANTHDDPINMHGTFTRVEQRLDDHTLVLKYVHKQQGGFPQFHVNDKVQFFTRNTLESTDDETQYTVTGVVNPGQGEYANDLKTMKVTFKETLPADLGATLAAGQPKYVAENVTYAPSVTIENCTFKNVNTRGILVTTRNPIVIKNNLFLNMSMSTIFLSNDSDDWYESGPIRDLTIEGNTFYIKSIGRTSWPYASAIYVHPVTYGAVGWPGPTPNQLAPSIPAPENAIHQNITIKKNTFYMDLDCVVKAESVRGLTITDNKIYRYNPDVALSLSGDTALSVGSTADLGLTVSGTRITGTNGVDLSANSSYSNLFELDKCMDVTLSGNIYDDGMKTVIVNSNNASKNVTSQDPQVEIVTSQSNTADPAATGVAFAVSDPTVASVSTDGTVTGLKAGAVQVYAYYAWNGSIIKSDPVTVTVSDSAQSQIQWEKAPGVSVAGTDRENTANWSAKSATGVAITQESGDIWKNAANSNNAKNIFLFDLPSGAGADDVVASVHVSNLPLKAAQGDYDSANLLLYVDDDHYAGMGKKAHMNGYTAMIEASGDDFAETEGQEANNDHTSATLLLWKSGNTIRFFAKPDGGGWTETASPAKTLSGTPKVGIACWGNDSPEELVFSDVRISRASSLTLGSDAAASANALDGFLAITQPTPIFQKVTPPPEMEWVKAPGCTITSENAEHYDHEDAYDITITPASGGLWQHDFSNVPNLVNLSLSAAPLSSVASDTNVTVAVDVSGMPTRVSQDNWDAAGLLLYTDLDNYIFVGKQAHLDGVMVIKELGAAGEEAEGDAALNDTTSATLVLHKSGNTVRAFCKANGTWSEITVPALPNGSLPTGLKVGLGAWNNVSPHTVTFSNLRVGAAVDLSSDSSAALDAFLSDTDPTPLFRQQIVGGDPVPTASGTLDNIWVDGAPVRGFSPATHDYTVTVPAVDRVRLEYAAATGDTVTIAGATVENGIVTLTENTTDLIITPGSGEPYTLTLKKQAAANVATLSTVTASGLTLSAPMTNNVGATVRYAQAAASTTTLTLIPTDENATVTLTRDSARTPVDLDEHGAATVPLYAGLNSFFADVTAADGVTSSRYILNVVRVAATDSALSSLTVNGQALADFDPAVTEYGLLSQGTALTLAAAPHDPNATVAVTVNGKRTLGANAAATLQEGINTVVVAVYAEDRSAVTHYTVKIVAAPLTPAVYGTVVSPQLQYSQGDYALAVEGASRSLELTAWRGDTASGQLLLASSAAALTDLTVTPSALTGADATIAAQNVAVSFLRSHESPKTSGGDALEAREILWTSGPVDLAAGSTQSVWLSVQVPQDTPAGTYTGTLTAAASNAGDPVEFTLTLTVADSILPAQSALALELGQNPYASAQYYNVTPFSPEHLAILEPILALYKARGGSAVTASIVEEPWNGRTYRGEESVKYPSMVAWSQDAQGAWHFDYTDFDTWITLNLSLGLGDPILCSSLAPQPYDAQVIRYRDDQGTWQTLSKSAGQTPWNAALTAFLEDFMAHVEEKGWKDRIRLTVDGAGCTAALLDLIDSVEGTDHKPFAVSGTLDDISTDAQQALVMRLREWTVGAAAQQANAATFRTLLESRKEQGLATYISTASGMDLPNSLSHSAPAESYWAPLYAAAVGAQGVSRWALDSWNAAPLTSTAYGSALAGDCFLVFPDEQGAATPQVHSSTRLEMLAQGVRDANKLLLIRQNCPALADRVDALFAGLAQKTYAAQDGYLTPAAKAALAQDMTALQGQIATLSDASRHILSNGYLWLREVDADTLKNHADSNSQQNPAVGSDGPAAWAFDDQEHWWHTRYNGAAPAGDAPSGNPSEENPLWIQTGFGEALVVGKIAYQCRTAASNRCNITNYQIQVARLDDPTAEPDDQDFTTVQTGVLADTSDEQEIVLLKPVEATHIRLVATGVYGSNNHVTAKRIRVFVQENVTPWGPTRIRAADLTALNGALDPSGDYTLSLCDGSADYASHQILAAYYTANGRLANLQIFPVDTPIQTLALSPAPNAVRARLFLVENGSLIPLTADMPLFTPSAP